MLSLNLECVVNLEDFLFFFLFIPGSWIDNSCFTNWNCSNTVRLYSTTSTSNINLIDFFLVSYLNFPLSLDDLFIFWNSPYFKSRKFYATRPFSRSVFSSSKEIFSVVHTGMLETDVSEWEEAKIKAIIIIISIFYYILINYTYLSKNVICFIFFIAQKFLPL